MKILLTGGAGYIGSHTLKQFLETDNEIVVLDNLSKGSQKSIDDLQNLREFNFVKMDLNDFDGVKKLFKEQKFPAQRTHDLLQKIQKIEPNFADTPYNLYDIFYEYYDENSAILHGNSRYWNKQPHLDKFYLQRISSHLIRILAIAVDLVENEISINTYKGFELSLKKLANLQCTLGLN